MSEEDQELLARISHLAGQINRHKNSQLEPSSSSGVHRHHHYSRGRAGGRYGRGYGHRNRTLVFNHGDGEVKRAHDESKNDAGAWVSKQGRHLQLINTAAYDREAGRSRSSSRPADASSGEDQETNRAAQSQNSGTKAAKHHLDVEGITFQVTEGGRRLVRITGSGTAHREGWKLTGDTGTDQSRPTPEKVMISSVQFHRTEDGNLERADATRGRWVTLSVEHQNLTRASTNTTEKAGLCKRFSNTGQCPRGPRCRHVHDPNKVAVCRDFLRSGKCPNGAHCDLSHECSYERVPACSHFQRGQCTKDDCRYAHVHVNPAAAVCRAFSTFGYCEKGSKCQDRHVFECPDYASTGQCSNKACRLPHIDRAGKLRQSTGETDMHLVGSDSQSDTPEEEDMIPLSGNADGALSQQDDFIKFS